MPKCFFSILGDVAPLYRRMQNYKCFWKRPLSGRAGSSPEIAVPFGAYNCGSTGITRWGNLFTGKSRDASGSGCGVAN